MEAVAHLERVQRRLEGDLAQMRNALADLQSRPEQNVGAVVAEVKVLQSLVERLYSARAARRRQPPHRAPRRAARRQPAAEARRAPAAPRGQRPASGGRSLPMPPVAEGLDEQEILDLVREGLRENAVELALQPIVSLPQRKRRFFECFSRVRTDDGRVIVPEQYLDVAERHGLVTAIDNLLLFRCIQTLRRIRKSNANVGFFLNISPQHAGRSRLLPRLHPADGAEHRAGAGPGVRVPAARAGAGRRLAVARSRPPGADGLPLLDRPGHRSRHRRRRPCPAGISAS